MQLNAVTFYARTAEDKKKWMEAIQEALNSVAPAQRTGSTHDPAMHSFDRPAHCQVCATLQNESSLVMRILAQWLSG